MSFRQQGEPITDSCCTRRAPPFFHSSIRGEESSFRSLSSTFLPPPPLPIDSLVRSWIHSHKHTFFALSTKSLLQKGESGQKTGRKITFSSNLILIFRRWKGELWKSEAALETRRDEWKMKDKMKWERERERELDGKGGIRGKRKQISHS